VPIEKCVYAEVEFKADNPKADKKSQKLKLSGQLMFLIIL
jgi:hypothetical protein